MTSTLAWQDEFSVGVKGIDRQHQELLARANALFEALGTDAPPEQLESLVTFLKDHVHTHFACEERLMRRHAYPGYARHLAAHRRFMDQLAWIDDLVDRASSCEALAARAATFVTDFLAEHFQREDRALADYLRAGGARLHATAGDQSALRSRTRGSSGPS